MEKIIRKISRENLLGDKLNLTPPALNPEPLFLNNINPYQCTDPDMSFEDCETTILDPLFIMDGIDGMIAQEYTNFISKVFIDNFQLGTFNWEHFSSEFTTGMYWDTTPPWVESAGDYSMRIQLTDAFQPTGFVYVGTKGKTVLEAGANYRVSFTLSTDVQYIKDQITASISSTSVMLWIENPESNLFSLLTWSTLETPVFPERDILTTTFTAPDGGAYDFTFWLYTGWSVLGSQAQTGDFWLFDDITISLEDTQSTENSFTSVKRDVFGFFKSFNIEATEYNLRLYENNINNYLFIEPLDVDELALGAYGNQQIDEDTGLQTGVYTLSSPPEGVVPFYYLSYNLYGALVTNVQGTTTTNDGFLYCQAPDLGPWDPNETYSLGDVVEDSDGKIWYCSDIPQNSCDLDPLDPSCSLGQCGWISCLNIVSYKTRNINLTFPLYQDIKDMGIYTDLIYPGIAEECSGSTETLTKDYKCPVPYFISDGGEVIFYDNQTTSEVRVERKCCEDYSEYGFVWFEGKCYKDYGLPGVGVGLELFNFTYPTLFIGRGDNQQLFDDGPVQVMDEISLNTSNLGTILNYVGGRNLIYTPLVSGLINGEKYVMKANLIMDYYDNSTLAVIKLSATGQLDPNWGYVWYQNFDLGSSDILPPVTEGPPCIGGNVTQTVQYLSANNPNGVLFTTTTNCNSANMSKYVQLDQGVEYRIRFGYIGLTNGSSPVSVANQLGNNDMFFEIEDIANSTSMLFDTFGGPGFYDKEYLFTPIASGTYALQIGVTNPMPPGNGPFGDYGFGLDYWALDERPFSYTQEENVIVDAVKTWSSNSGDVADGTTSIQLESIFTLTNASNLSLRLVCDVKEAIITNPLSFGLTISDISLKKYTTPNFLGCEKTNFLNEVSKNLVLTGQTMFDPDGNPNTLNSYLADIQFDQGQEIITTSVPYVTTVSNTDTRIFPAAGAETSALCEPSQLVVGWHCVPEYPYLTGGVVQVGNPVAACVASTVIIPGVTMYASAQQCLNNSTCNWTAGCTDSIAYNYNEDANTPCVDQTLPGYPLTSVHNVEGDCCIYPIFGCMNPSSLQYDPLANEETGQSSWYLGQQIFNEFGMFGTCSFPAGCSDPMADNYSQPSGAPDFGCAPSLGVNGNVVTCTDCLGNPPSSLFGHPLYPEAILPGTMGDVSCCEYDTSGDLVAGCTDFTAVNYDPLAQLDDGSCSYSTTWTVWCCDFFVVGPCCYDVTVTTQVTYQSMIDSFMCFDDLADCNGGAFTPCNC